MGRDSVCQSDIINRWFISFCWLTLHFLCCWSTLIKQGSVHIRISQPNLKVSYSLTFLTYFDCYLKLCLLSCLCEFIQQVFINIWNCATCVPAWLPFSCQRAIFYVYVYVQPRPWACTYAISCWHIFCQVLSINSISTQPTCNLICLCLCQLQTS